MPGTAAKKPAGRRSATGRRAGASGTKRAAAKKPAAKRTGTKKTAAKKPRVKKTAVKKTAVKKTAAKKTAKKATAKSSAKKTTAKKTGPKRGTPKKTPPKKTAPARPAAKKTPAARPVTKRPPPAAATGAKKGVPTKAPAAATKKARPALPPLLPPAGTPTKGRSGKKTVICPLSGFEVTPAPANLSPKTLERLRQKLLDEKARLGHQAQELTAEAEQLAREREAGDTQFDEESGEGDTVNIERERDLLLSATARQVVEEIDDAIDRIKRGKYGVCKPAGRKISLERLEAIPWAQVCVDCKARAERRR
jgi:RNA polymerase-binding protein DksA